MPPLRSKSPVAAISVFCLLLSVLFVGCFRDPNVRKQKFYEQGNAYFKQGKYSEAQISYARALQIDPRFTDALYRSARA
jgi:tetratricopeptide (TPR) repeat protein